MTQPLEKSYKKIGKEIAKIYTLGGSNGRYGKEMLLNAIDAECNRRASIEARMVKKEGNEISGNGFSLTFSEGCACITHFSLDTMDETLATARDAAQDLAKFLKNVRKNIEEMRGSKSTGEKEEEE